MKGGCEQWRNTGSYFILKIMYFALLHVLINLSFKLLTKIWCSETLCLQNSPHAHSCNSQHRLCPSRLVSYPKVSWLLNGFLKFPFLLNTKEQTQEKKTHKLHAKPFLYFKFYISLHLSSFKLNKITYSSHIKLKVTINLLLFSH